MNNRIKWLALNAGFDLGHDWEVIGLSEDSLKTYTELIVKECAKVANDNFDKGFCPVGDFIKEHFGVEC